MRACLRAWRKSTTACATRHKARVSALTTQLCNGENHQDSDYEDDDQFGRADASEQHSASVSATTTTRQPRHITIHVVEKAHERREERTTALNKIRAGLYVALDRRSVLRRNRDLYID